ncbi:hypothetical protein G6F31_014366 [Rhizopus arrhizus]|nr:hypothetical protein G6F31_014366 [Rhizopus arrhizus]
MWYFAWILGAGLASTVAILNGMWFEAREQNRIEKENQRYVRDVEVAGSNPVSPTTSVVTKKPGRQQSSGFFCAWRPGNCQ